MSSWWERGDPLVSDVKLLASQIPDGSIAAVSLASALASLADGSLSTLHNHAAIHGTPVNAVAATGTVGTDGTSPANNNTVTINGTVYTFKTTMTGANGEVHLDADPDVALLNLLHAINGTGGTPVTDYKVAAAHATVSADTTIAANTATLTAKTKGVAGNLLTLAKSGSHLTIGGAVFIGGINGTVGAAWEVHVDAEAMYVCTALQTIADANWRSSAAWNSLAAIPTLASLPTGFVTIRYVAGSLVLYLNDGGTIKSLTLGEPS